MPRSTAASDPSTVAPEEPAVFVNARVKPGFAARAPRSRSSAARPEPSSVAKPTRPATRPPPQTTTRPVTRPTAPAAFSNKEAFSNAALPESRRRSRGSLSESVRGGRRPSAPRQLHSVPRGRADHRASLSALMGHSPVPEAPADARAEKGVNVAQLKRQQDAALRALYETEADRVQVLTLRSADNDKRTATLEADLLKVRAKQAEELAAAEAELLHWRAAEEQAEESRAANERKMLDAAAASRRLAHLEGEARVALAALFVPSCVESLGHRAAPPRSPEGVPAAASSCAVAPTVADAAGGDRSPSRPSLDRASPPETPTPPSPAPSACTRPVCPAPKSAAAAEVRAVLDDMRRELEELELSAL